MAEDEELIYLKTEKQAALRAFSRNREELIRFYKSLGQFGDRAIPPEMREEEESSPAIEAMESILSGAIARFSKLEPMPEGRALDAAVARLSLAMFIIDRLGKLRGLVLAGDSLPMLSLFTSLRNRAAEMLTSEYYSKSIEDITGGYLDFEPLLTACSELCGLAVPSLPEIMSEYKMRLAREVDRA